ncbi:MAG: cytochrome c biogenesis protein CcsA [Zoogloeaceae bacterium]|jgi:ABC-type uncharacterized transport system permease subunit|nr:cytochrome c biogenesis protein CcsA [Zoogloeaceae bacterium]
MAIVNQLTLSSLTGLLYLVLGIHFWRTRWRAANPSAGLRLTVTQERIAIGIALCLHAFLLKQALFVGNSLHFSFSLAFSLMIWLATLIYWLESFRVRMDGLQPIVLSAGALAILLTLCFPESHPVPHAETWNFRLHFLTAMLALSLALLAAAHAILMSLVEKGMRRPQRSQRLANMPPLLTMENLLFRMLSAAFLLLTLALCFGFLYSQTLFGHPPGFNHKTVFTLISWLIFAALLIGRHVWGWRGRKALRFTLSGFVALLLAYVGSRFVLEVLLHRL